MDKSIDELKLKKEGLARDIIGEIAMASDPPKTLKKWRSLFRASQKAVARELGITSSVISDYESGRRRSPGILFLRKYVETLIDIDEKNGGEVLKGFLYTGDGRSVSSAIADIKEYEKGVPVDVFCREIGARMLVASGHGSEKIYGYTVIDSVKAITELSFAELVKLYGVTSQRALVFTNITTGKGPMIALKVANIKPALVVLHNIGETDVSGVARNIASIEGVPLAVIGGSDLEHLIAKLKSLG